MGRSVMFLCRPRVLVPALLGTEMDRLPLERLRDRQLRRHEGAADGIFLELAGPRRRAGWRGWRRGGQESHDCFYQRFQERAQQQERRQDREETENKTHKT